MPFINYAAVIAATQTHVGGTQWWKTKKFISNLYSFEPEILLISSSKSHSSRWAGYSAVFRGMPLVGFPDLPSWSMESWTKALFHSPLAGPEEASWSGRTLADGTEFPFKLEPSPWDAFLKSVRDMQIIRPKIFGTLEFRADPAQRDADNILAMAALRLGLCAYLIANPVDNSTSLPHLRREWWSTAMNEIPAAQHYSSALSTIKCSQIGLSRRALNEEKFLRPILDRAIGRALA
jgi:hypothetical protein